MKRLGMLAAVTVLLGAVLAPTASAGNSGNGAPSGGHYNLNLIGKAGPIGDDLVDSSRHTIFVRLSGQTKIWLCESGVDPDCANVADFAVLDGNGTDGNATFALPDPVDSCVVDPATGEFTSCTTKYSVFARVPGKYPYDGNATLKTCGFVDSTDPTSVLCSAQVFEVKQSQKFQNVSKYLLFVFADVDGDGQVELVPIFDDRLENFYWQYDNTGAKVVQLRFYGCASTVSLDGTQVDTCPRTGNTK